jgi:hypothetical protein
MGHSARLPALSSSASYVRGLDSWTRRALTFALVVNACDPQNFEPNLALNLEIADLINAKKGSA